MKKLQLEECNHQVLERAVRLPCGLVVWEKGLRLNTSSGVIEIVTVRGRANINLAVSGEWREKCGFEKHLGIRVGGTFD